MNDAERMGSFAAFPEAEAVSDAVIHSTFSDPMGIEDFWFRWYLNGFVDQGHGKVKCVLGRPGSGKTHFLRHLAMKAREVGYQAAYVDAAKERISLVDELYRAVATKVDWSDIVDKALWSVITGELGYPEFSGFVSQFIAWGESTRHLSPNLLRRDVREAIDRFLYTVDLQPDFSMGLRTWMNQEVSLEPGSTAVREWLQGNKLGVSQRKSLGVRSNVSRRNARSFLASLASFIHYAQGQGLMIFIDNIDTMAAKTRVEGRPYYTRSARDQSYEMIRELIDESPFTPYLMTVIAGNTDQVTNSKTGFPSYPALWTRLQNEVQSPNPNRFADVLDLDRMWEKDESQQEALTRHWGETPIEWSTLPQETPIRNSMGLEWGRPRRMVAEVVKQRLPETRGDL
jgi:hypothetical protein